MGYILWLLKIEERSADLHLGEWAKQTSEKKDCEMPLERLLLVTGAPILGKITMPKQAFRVKVAYELGGWASRE